MLLPLQSLTKQCHETRGRDDRYLTRESWERRKGEGEDEVEEEGGREEGEKEEGRREEGKEQKE